MVAIVWIVKRIVLEQIVNDAKKTFTYDQMVIVLIAHVIQSVSKKKKLKKIGAQSY